MLTINTPREVLLALAAKAKALRLAKKLTQEGLARRSGLSLGSLKRFELSGQISLESLLKIALVLDRLEGFTELFPKQEVISSLDALLKVEPKRQRGNLK